MKGVCLVTFIIIFSLFACKSEPEPVQTIKPQAVPAEEPKRAEPVSVPNEPTPVIQNDPISPPVKPQTTVFDPSSISQQERDKAKMEIQDLIKQLNGIIRAKDYNSWVQYLGSDYFATINSPEFLEQVSKSPVLVRQKIVLKTAQDYFYNVVVPARKNDRVDDIEFVSQDHVKAYIITGEGTRNRLYDLQRTGTGWKIIN